MPSNFQVFAPNRANLTVAWSATYQPSEAELRALQAAAIIPGVRLQDDRLEIALTAAPLPELQRVYRVCGIDADRIKRFYTEGSFDSFPREAMWQPKRVPYEYQAAAAFDIVQCRKKLVSFDMGLGKALCVSAQVLTPTGFRRIGDLMVGDLVIDPDGGTAAVEGVYPQGPQETFTVTTRFGAKVRATADHLWLVRTATEKLRKLPGKVLTTAEIQSLGLTQQDKRGWVAARFFLPVSVAAEFAAQPPLPLAAYLIGALIGDGCLTQGTRICLPDTEIRRRIESLGYELGPASSGDSCPTHTVLGCVDALRELGLYGRESVDKALPAQCALASVEDRIELLRGLMDTDGDCGAQGLPVYSTSSEQLAQDVMWLVRSLGGVPSVSRKAAPKYTHNGEVRTGQPAYRVNVRVPFNPFHLPRKANAWKKPLLANAIVSIEPYGVEECVCIKVSTKRDLYVTDDFIVTHNTGVAIQAAETIRRQQEQRGGKAPVVIIGPLFTRATWRNELVAMGVLESASEVCCLTSRDLLDASWNQKAKYIFVHYDVVHAWWSRINTRRPCFVIVDEGHWVKNGRAARSSGTMMVAGSAPYCAILTATPMTNRPSELWHLLSILTNPFAFGSPIDFRVRYAGAMFNGHGHEDTQPTHVEELRMRISNLYVRKTAEDVALYLPPLTRQFYEVDPEAPLSRHESMSTEQMAALVKAVRDGQVAQVLDLLNDLRKETSALKLAHTVEFAADAIAQGEKVVIFTWQRAMVKKIATKLSKTVVVHSITGEDDLDAREAAVAAFQSGEGDAIVATLGALKEGVTLHAARIVIMHDLDWVPASLRQAEKRILRIGQTRPCVSVWMMCRQSVDMIFASMLLRKLGNIETTLGEKIEGFDGLDDIVSREEDAQHAKQIQEWLNW